MREHGTTQLEGKGEKADLPASIWWTRVLGSFAVLFGLLSLLAAGSVLVGARDVGYPVAQPLLVFNMAMGLPYIAAGGLILARKPAALRAAGAIALINLLVLGLVLWPGSTVATESRTAMAVRTVVWVVVYAAIARGPVRRSLRHR